MTLEVLQAAMIAAMKNHDKIRKDVLSSLVEAAKKATIQKKTRVELTEELVDQVILKEKKTVQEMIDTCPADRVELLNGYKSKMIIIDEFIPKIMTDVTEIRDMITTLLSDAGVEALKSNKNQIMKIVMPQMKGKADMKIVNMVLLDMMK